MNYDGTDVPFSPVRGWKNGLRSGIVVRCGRGALTGLWLKTKFGVERDLFFERTYVSTTYVVGTIVYY